MGGSDFERWFSDWNGCSSAFQIVALLHHFVGGLHGLGVHLISALGQDEVHHFLDDFDVGKFEVTLVAASPKPFWPGVPSSGGPEAAVSL